MSEHPVAHWHRFLRSPSQAGLLALLAEEVEFHSPVVHRPQVGRALVSAYLGAAFRVFLNPHFHYVRELLEPGGAVLEFVTEIDGIHVNGVDMIRWNDDGLITEFKVMVRPLKAIQLIHQRMGEMLATGGKLPAGS
ncbi:MAG: nuclear transport factor 2 family protein [Verrucomicrobia bacterium]|nr:nuclear transport factor 2 family protein [Verrucomicrobiota bacterium]